MQRRSIKRRLFWVALVCVLLLLALLGLLMRPFADSG
jgi:hypothetical protein